MSEWIEFQEQEIPDELLSQAGGQRLIASILMRRGLQDPNAVQAFLNPDFYSPADPVQMPGLVQAADRLEQAIQRRETVLVWGDFDVDGQTAATLLVSAIQFLGGLVRYHIPVRSKESHGVSEQVLQHLLDSHADIRLVLTCDTGISAHAAVELAQERGVEVIITDHHTLPDSLPQAMAIVNPRLLPPDHALAAMPGVGVAYHLAWELHRRRGNPQACRDYLDLLALGIVADLAEVRRDVRYFLQRGLAALRQTERLGLKIIMELAEVDPATLSEEQIGYLIAPRLNAVGRLGDANLVVELLTSNDEGKVRLIAEQIEGYNARRQLLTSQVLRAAISQIEADATLLADPLLFLSQPTWPAGVIGIVASRLVERYSRPVVLVANPPDELARGSARSVPGLDITAALAANAQLLAGFGGHAMAAGFSVENENLAELRRGLNRQMHAAGILPRSTLVIDGYIPLRDVTPGLVADLERLSPFGSGNPPVTLACHNLRVAGYAAIGRSQEHLMVTVEDEWDGSHRVIWWQGAEWSGEPVLAQGAFDLAYTLRMGSYRGRPEIQIEWKDARHILQAPEISAATPIKVEDYRTLSDPLPVFLRFCSQPGAQVWAEGAQLESLKKILGLPLDGCISDRTGLKRGKLLLIWTSPPGQAELNSAVKTVQPEQVILFTSHPQENSIHGFLTRLAGLVKHVMVKGKGQTSLRKLAAATAQREQAVLLGLQWLQGKGHLNIIEVKGDQVILDPTHPAEIGEMGVTEGLLKKVLDETAAYRDFYAHTDFHMLGLDSV